MHSRQLTRLVVDALDELKAVDLRVLDVRNATTITDYMIIASGRSNRHVRAMGDKVVETTKKSGIQPLGVEGHAQAQWILIDLGDVIVHTMQPATREFYQLEKLWGDAEHQAVQLV
jgi:ribosome-associated protein